MITETLVWWIAIAMVAVPALVAIGAGIALAIMVRSDRAKYRAQLAVATRPQVTERA